VVIYPKELTGLAQAVSSRDVMVPDDTEDHSELYSAIINESDQFEHPPVFMREDCDQLTNHPVWALKIGQWMLRAARVATGSRPRVLEDGPDVMNSDDEDSKKDEHGDELTGTFVGCSSLEQARITEQQAQDQLAAFTGSLVLTPPESDRPKSPTGEDWSWRSPKELKLAQTAVRSLALSAAPPRPAIRLESDPEIQAPVKAPPLEIVKATAIPAAELPKGLKAAASQATETSSTVKRKTKAAAPSQAPADQPKETKVSTRKKGQEKGQESPGTKVPPPMQTRAQARDASGAGGLRGVDGSGSIEAVCGSSSPARKPGS
jgi:hypothetical protein